ncbi:MAG: hypothetical protein J6X07_08975 [Prevotella sp.]|nr:hypothetical protein [Prevotella sp.]
MRINKTYRHTLNAARRAARFVDAHPVLNTVIFTTEAAAAFLVVLFH